MAGLGETTAALARLRQRKPASSQPGSTGLLKPQTDFGPNPGQLGMLVHEPPGLAKGRPLVVVLHGCTQTAEGYAAGAGWLTLADRFGFAVVCPEQRSGNNANLCFNWFEPHDVRRGQGEALSIRNMVEAAAARFASDRAQIFVTGLSAGGAMTSALLAAYPEVFAGGGIVAGLPHGVAQGMPQAFAAMFQDNPLSAAQLGNLVRGASSHPGPWPRVSVWHGQADTTVKVSNADAIVAQWSDVQRLGGSPTRSETRGRRRHDVWLRDGRPVLERHLIKGMGHGAPLAGGGPDGAGTPGPYLLEVGISSSLELLQFWGVTADDTAKADATEARAKPAPAAAGGRRVSGIEEIIHKALKAAGLM